MSCLYILDFNPLLVISFANIFSHSVGCLFVLSMVSLSVQKLLSLMRFQLFIFAFVSFALGDPKKCCYDLCQRVFCLSSRSYMISGLIHFEFIFVYSVRKCSNFILLHVAVRFSQRHLLKRLSFLH